MTCHATLEVAYTPSNPYVCDVYTQGAGIGTPILGIRLTRLYARPLLHTR